MKRLIAGGVVLVGVAAAVIYVMRPAPVDRDPAGQSVGTMASSTSRSSGAIVPSATAKAAVVATSTANLDAKATTGAVEPANAIGTVQPVAEHTNKQVDSVIEALRTKQHPERLSTMIQPAPFDAAAFSANPQAYVDTVEPGRAFQSAQPGTDVPVLMPVGRTRFTIDQDGQAILRVRSKAGAPVTFTSFDLGRFGNGLVSQTVVADGNDVASVSFTAGAGTTDAVHILAASPVATEQVSFDIMVSSKKVANGG